MHYCINSLLKNNNGIMQYCIISNDIALIMHYRALLQMPGANMYIVLAGWLVGTVSLKKGGKINCECRETSK